MARRWLVLSVVHTAISSCSLLCSGQTFVLQSAELGATGRIGGTSVTVAQFVGWRFETTEPLAIQRVGGHLLSFPDEPGEIFAALVRLQSISSVPTGAPFTAQEVVATTTFRPPFPSDEVIVPLEATLPPGSYTLVFGTGLFGATGAGALHNGDDQPDIPPTNISSFIFWSIPFSGQPFEWRTNLASHMRFVFEALPVVSGDYNQSGAVDAADYVAWRKGMATGDYATWRTNFGIPSGGGGSAVASALGEFVPEPATWMLMIFAIAGVSSRRR